MTTTAPEAPGLTEIFTPNQLARTAALQVASEVLRGGLTAPKAADLASVAEFVIGTEPDVAEAPKPVTTTIHFNAASINPDALSLYFGSPVEVPKVEEPLVGSVTVEDAEGLEALPTNAKLIDGDGDEWDYRGDGEWGWSISTYSPSEIEEDDMFPMVVLNPEVLGNVQPAPVEIPAEPVFALDADALADLPIHSYVVTPNGSGYHKVGRDRFRGIELTRNARDLAEVGAILVAYIADGTV
jgi:hypothetical protein